MESNVKYICGVLLHKWYVFLESWKLGIPWRGLLHDISKFCVNERGPRVKSICTTDARGMMSVSDDLALSWIHHYHKNPHHWQWWVTTLDDGTTRVLPMSDQYRREMLAEWRTVSRIPSRMDVVSWYIQNRNRMILHAKTRQWVETQIGIK